MWPRSRMPSYRGAEVWGSAGATGSPAADDPSRPATRTGETYVDGMDAAPSSGPVASGRVAYTRVGDLLLGLIGLALLRSRVTDLGGKAFCDARVADMRQILDDWDDPAFQRDANWEDAPAAEGWQARAGCRFHIRRVAPR